MNENQKSGAGPDGIPFEEAQAIDAEPQSGSTRAITAWTPQDAADFLARAIRESQRPLTEAIRHRGVDRSVVLLGLLTILVFGTGLLALLVRMERRGAAAAPAEETAVSSAVATAVEPGQVAAFRQLVTEAEGRAARAEGERDALARRLEEALQTRNTAEAENLRRIEDLVEIASSSAEEVRQLRAAAPLTRKQLDAKDREIALLREQLATAEALVRTLQGADTAAPAPSSQELKEKAEEKAEEVPGAPEKKGAEEYEQPKRKKRSIDT